MSTTSIVVSGVGGAPIGVVAALVAVASVVERGILVTLRVGSTVAGCFLNIVASKTKLQ